MTPQIQAAQENNPAQYFVLGDPTFCTSAIRAIKTLGITTPILIADTCLGPDSGASIPGGYEGVSVVVQSALDPESEDVQLAQAIMDEYAPDVALDVITATAYQAALGFVQAVNASAPAEVTKESITTALQQMPEQEYPLSDGSTFQCNGQALPAISPNVCSTYGIVADAAEDGTLSNYRTVDTEGIYTLG
jgi:ABC-type branched-subunit amino acid transport system substrate-binding protein